MIVRITSAGASLGDFFEDLFGDCMGLGGGESSLVINDVAVHTISLYRNCWCGDWNDDAFCL